MASEAIGAAFQENSLDDAISVQRVQDDLYRKFKIKYSSELEKRHGLRIDDTMTAERVMLLDAIQNGDVNQIRASYV